MKGWLVQIFPAEFGFKWTDHIVDGVRDDDQLFVRNYSIPRWSTEMFSPSGNHGNAEKGNLPTQASDDQIRYYWQKTQSSSPMSWMGLEMEVLIFGNTI